MNSGEVCEKYPGRHSFVRNVLLGSFFQTPLEEITLPIHLRVRAVRLQRQGVRDTHRSVLPVGPKSLHICSSCSYQRLNAFPSFKQRRSRIVQDPCGNPERQVRHVVNLSRTWIVRSQNRGHQLNHGCVFQPRCGESDSQLKIRRRAAYERSCE